MRNRLLLVALLLILAACAYFGGLFEFLSPEHLRALLTDSGAWGPVVVVVLFTLLEPFGAPGFVFLIAAATLWPFWLALTVNWLGATGAGLLGFVFARYMGRDWVSTRMPRNLRKWDERLSQRGLPFVIGYRVLFFLNPASHWALGLSQVSAPAAVAGTAIGFAPWVFIWTYFGADILVWLETQAVGIWIAIGAAVLALVVFRRTRARRAARKPD